MFYFEELFSEGFQLFDDLIRNREETIKGIRSELGIAVFELISNEDFNTLTSENSLHKF